MLTLETLRAYAKAHAQTRYPISSRYRCLAADLLTERNPDFEGMEGYLDPNVPRSFGLLTQELAFLRKREEVGDDFSAVYTGEELALGIDLMLAGKSPLDAAREVVGRQPATAA